MHLRRTSVIVTAVVAAVIVVVIDGMTFMGMLGQDDPTKKDDPAAYTKAFIQKAIERYERDGRQVTVDHYNEPGNRDGQWYAFIIDESGYTISHFNPEIRGRDPALRVDATGYFFGDDLLSATAEGRWVEYVAVNPTTGNDQKKHTWAVRHDELIFCSGWYEE